MGNRFFVMNAAALAKLRVYVTLFSIGAKF